ncbi:hypothetical protein BpHYR1_037998 [Brachionus plicatilis]|uniref:SWIM-type domain-containing protein n=1 Tax=Brachionus plicatilis TaxID=10195 RepID=A0A3M7QZG9_BRAPC|nr:hypothetical protein BpHYR1_037998 [Brachionus plicatilis]
MPPKSKFVRSRISSTSTSILSLSRCSCDWNSKNYICKLVIGVRSKLKIGDFQIPIASVNKPLGKKRSRGRPTLASTSGRSHWIQKSLNAYIIQYNSMMPD